MSSQPTFSIHKLGYIERCKLLMDKNATFDEIRKKVRETSNYFSKMPMYKFILFCILCVVMVIFSIYIAFLFLKLPQKKKDMMVYIWIFLFVCIAGLYFGA